MNWEDEVTLSGQPLVLPTRPIRQGGRYRAEDRTVYVQGGNRLLIPAVPHRSASASGHGRHSPTQIFITNQNRDDHSPVRSSRRRSQHDRRFEDDDDDSPPRHGRNRSRARARSRSHSRRRESRTPSPSKSEIEKRVKHEERMKRLVELEKREEEQERRHKYEQERLLEEAQRAEQKKREDELKKRAIEDHEIELAKEAVKAKEKKEREEKEFQERVKTTFAAAGYSEESIEQILQKDGKGKEVQKKIVDLRRPTYIKVNRKYLSPDTLDAYSLPWEWDERDSTFIIIKRWIPESEQEVLFEHTRQMREGRVREGRLLTDTTVEVKKRDDKLMIVRKRSPSRRRSKSRSWILT